MGYDALQQEEEDDDRFEDYDGSGSAPPYPLQRKSSSRRVASPRFGPSDLFLDEHEAESSTEQTAGFRPLRNPIVAPRSARTTATYGMGEGEDDAEEGRDSPGPAIIEGLSSTNAPFVPLHITAPKPRAPATTSESRSDTSLSPHSATREPMIVRIASGRTTLRHPTPDLQALQGACTGNVQLLEKTAERLSMTSSIDDAIRDLHSEQKRNDSRRSSLMSSPDLPSVTRQFSNASIVRTNSVARSGGYSPAGFMMSPKGSSITGGRGRSASKSSRYGSRPEPELEGRPLDSFVNLQMPEPTSPLLSRPASIKCIKNQDESSEALTRPVVDLLDGTKMGEALQLYNDVESSIQQPMAEEERPESSADMTTFEQAHAMFEDFDGVHVERHSKAEEREPGDNAQRRVVSENRQFVAGGNVDSQRRLSAGNRLSMARPQSYADPNTGQQMVYYPAPVPMMLNLPQKLSKASSSMARNKRRSQVLSSLPQAVRQSAIWLPDVLETEDEPDLPEDDELQQQEYVPQHQRMSMGGRRLTQDLQHLPPQLRATAFFELQTPNQVVELKEQSAVATLDSILDASAHAPVSAFTDHVFAGRLGAEVYGKSHTRNSKGSTQLLQPEQTAKKRASSFNLLRGRRASSSDLLESENEKKRASIIADIRDGRIIRDPLDEDEEEGAVSEAGDENERAEEEELYQGAPTTLLAELQLRKQQFKMRTRPVASAYPNGIRSTLLELDAVAQVEQKSRKQKRIQLAWEDPFDQDMEDGGEDEDVPLAVLYANKAQIQEPNRPMGLMERRDMEDNEPLSRRRDRLQGRPPTMMPRASTMMNFAVNSPEEEDETLAQRGNRLKEGGADLPSARPVSGDFASEMMSQFGVDLKDSKGKGKELFTSPALEEEETLGQRRKRLQAEREARALEVGTPGEAPDRPKMQTKRSMADILSAHPAASGIRNASYGRAPPPTTGLLALHEKEKLRRASTMFNVEPPPYPGRQPNAGGFKAGVYNDGQGGIVPQQPPLQRTSTYNMFASPTAGFTQQAFPQQGLGMGMGMPPMGYNAFATPNQMMMPFANPYAMSGGMQMNGAHGVGMNGVNGMGMNMGMGMPYMQPNPMAQMSMLQMGGEPLNQGQIDMVERWRQSVMQ